MKLSASLVICLLGLSDVSAQVGKDAILRRFAENRINYYQEKITVHTDQSSYIAGETLWASIYLVDGHLHRPSTLSSVVYLDILDQGGKPVWQGSVKTSNGHGECSQVLPTQLPTGYYVLRAYTRWMRNDSQELFFSKTIFILNPGKKPVWSATPADTLLLEASPEGQVLVAGVENRITCRLFNGRAAGKVGQLVVVDNGRDTVLTLSTHSTGFAEASFVPARDHQYSVRTTDQNGKRISTALPPTQSIGYAIMVDPDNQGSRKIIVRKPAASGDAGCFIVTHCRLTKPQASYVTFRNGIAVAEISDRDLGDGVNQLWVTDDNGRLMAQRLLFRQPRVRARVLAELPGQPQARGTALTIPVSVLRNTGVAGRSKVSASVYRVADSSIQDGISPLHQLLVQSDLSVPDLFSSFHRAEGLPDAEMDAFLRIHRGNPYFAQAGTAGQSTRNLLIPEKEGPIAEALVTYASSGLPAAGVPVSVSFSGLRYQFRMGQSDSAGRLAVPLETTEGSGTIAYQPYAFSQDSFAVIPIAPYDDRKWRSNLPPASPEPSALAFLEDRMIEAQLSAAYGWKDQGALKVGPLEDSSAFFGYADRKYLLDDYVRFKTMEEVLREYVQEVFVKKSGNQYAFQVTDVVNGGTFSDAPLVLLDGIPIRDANLVMKIDPLKIQTISILGRKYQIGNQQFNGIVVFQTYDGSLEGIELPNDLLLADHSGLRFAREFHQPVGDRNAKDRQPDLRQLLYWNPALMTGTDGKASLQFTTSEVPGLYAIDLWMLDEQGNIGSGRYYLRVQ